MQNDLTIEGLGRVVRAVPSIDRPTGLFLNPGGFQGWEGLPMGRRESLARALTHGEHDVPVKLPARVLTLDGRAVGRTVFALREHSQSVTGWGATGDRFTLTVDHQGQKLTATVRRLLSECDDTGRRDGRWFVGDFETQFIAADPRKYGDTKTLPETGAATSIPVRHRGNFPAFMVVEIPDAPSSYTIDTPGGIYTITGATSGGTHRVDTRTGRVTRNGVWMPGVGRGPLWAVPDGPASVVTLSVPGRVFITNTFV